MNRTETLSRSTENAATMAVVLNEPEALTLRPVKLRSLADDDVMVEIVWSGISTGTERLLYTGRMPPFPGMGYPLVPGYESVGRIVDAGSKARDRIGEAVFVPGSTGFVDARGLFGGAAARAILPSARAMALPQSLADPLDERAVLLALAATAQHCFPGGEMPDLIVGHGVLGRLLARLAVAHSAAPPTVWEINPARADGAEGYTVMHPDEDTRRDYRSIYDVSGAPDLLDTLIGRMGHGGEIVLAGFYDNPLSFTFPPAFMKEARIRIAAEWQPDDLAAVSALIESGALSLDGLITHRAPAADAADAYPTAFHDADCLKMIMDWRGLQ